MRECRKAKREGEEVLKGRERKGGEKREGQLRREGRTVVFKGREERRDGRGRGGQKIREEKEEDKIYLNLSKDAPGVLNHKSLPDSLDDPNSLSQCPLRDSVAF